MIELLANDRSHDSSMQAGRARLATRRSCEFFKRRNMILVDRAEYIDAIF